MRLDLIAETRVSELMEEARNLGFVVPRPKVIFKKRGMVAGTMSNSGIMDLNAKLMEQNIEDFTKETIGHEFAHHICFIYYPNATMAHGPEWKAIMTQLGLSPNRCHSYDVSDVKARELNKFKYVCNKCKEAVILTSIRHNKVVKDGKWYSHAPCKGSVLKYERELGKVSYDRAFELAKGAK